MSILPLPQFEADLAAYEEDLKIYERLQPPKTMVVRFGDMKLIGEFPYKGDAKPGCGSKIVVKTHRGTEIGEMLTSTCPNAGCSKSVSRKEMLEYIENSGGRDYPFFEAGEVLRVANTEDLNTQARLENEKKGLLMRAREIADPMGLDMRLIEAEPILGGERLTFYFTSEDRVDFRDLLGLLAREFHTRIDLRQVGARDEARLIADYEKCGQHCCCKQFLKVLRPISMSAAKRQKHTLDPLKISGRCGRLMCCLRYEDSTYIELKQRLPNRRSRVITPEGPGAVIDSQVLTQLVLVALDAGGEVAVPVEDLEKERPGSSTAPTQTNTTGERTTDRDREDPIKSAIRKAKQEERQRRQDIFNTPDTDDRPAFQPNEQQQDGAPAEPTKRKRRRKRRQPEGTDQPTPTDQPQHPDQPMDMGMGRQDPSPHNLGDADEPPTTDEPTDRPRKRRRRRRDGQPTPTQSEDNSNRNDNNNDNTPFNPNNLNDNQQRNPDRTTGGSDNDSISNDNPDGDPLQQPRKKRRRRRRRPPGEDGGSPPSSSQPDQPPPTPPPGDQS